MPYDELDLFQSETIDALWIRLELAEYGWKLTMGHRHRGQQGGECGTERYEDLTIADALDVIGLTATTIGHAL